MLSIRGGKFRGRKLHCPTGKAIRPTTSFVRESLFSILGPRIPQSRFLDLYAGCGIVGFEALSRGALYVQAIEKNPQHCKLLQQNATILRLENTHYQSTCSDVLTWLRKQNPVTPASTYDIIFADPPYTQENPSVVFTTCLSNGLLSPGGLFIWETSTKQIDLPDNARLIDTRKYGTTCLFFLENAAD